MPFVDNQGIKIHYELIGKGPPLVLMHGYTGNLERWKLLGYVDYLSDTFQLILVDARGHGLSDKPHESEEYAWSKRTSDVVCVLKSIGISKCHFFGYSMGGLYAFYLAKSSPEIFESMIVWGAHPYASSFDGFTDVDGQDSAKFMNALEVYLGEEISPEGRKLILDNDLKALVAAATDRDSIEHFFPEMLMPTLVMAGVEDARYPLIKKCATELPNASFVEFVGCGHLQAKTPKDEVFRHLTAFFNKVARDI